MNRLPDPFPLGMTQRLTAGGGLAGFHVLRRRGWGGHVPLPPLALPVEHRMVPAIPGGEHPIKVRTYNEIRFVNIGVPKYRRKGC